jgi:mannose-6-phosphate isomerase-like protein (cupin superfamily)
MPDMFHDGRPIATAASRCPRISASSAQGETMFMSLKVRRMAGAALACIVLATDSTLQAQVAAPPGASTPTTSTAGLILKEYEGETRLRRPGGNNGTDGASSFIIKVDRQFGNSPTFYMGMEDIPPGKKIRLHHHPHAEEILFIHRGSGMVRLGAREAAVSAGATVYVPRDVSVGLKNTGSEPLSLVFVFPEPDGMSGQMRSGSVPLGETPVPFTPAELAARNARGGGHIVFDEPAGQ